MFVILFSKENRLCYSAGHCTMVFYFYEDAMQSVRKISVDGLVPNSYHLSHWVGNETPAALKADTSTEIALNFISDVHYKSLFPNANILTNNHFDTDGLLSVFTLLYPDKAENIAKTLIDTAEACDFLSFSSEDGVKINILIAEICHAEKSPFRKQWKRFSGPKESIYYKTLLQELPGIIKQKDEYSNLWRGKFDKIVASMEMFEKRAIWVQEYNDVGLTVVINDVKPAPQAIDYYCKGDIFLIIEDNGRPNGRDKGRYGYELSYRYYSWADTIRRPHISKLSTTHLAEYLNRNEKASIGKWRSPTPDQPFDSTKVLSFTDDRGAPRLSTIPPDEVTKSVLSHLEKIKRETLGSVKEYAQMFHVEHYQK